MNHFFKRWHIAQKLEKGRLCLPFGCLSVAVGGMLILGVIFPSTVFSQTGSQVELLEQRIARLQQENQGLQEKINDLSTFAAYKTNYILVYSKSSRDDDRSVPSEDAEVKFQLSFKQRLAHWENAGQLYLGYTQKSFWRMYDGEDSRPFRETNYNPEIFYRSPVWFWGRPWQWQVGLEHESNGAREPESKSWNRFYLQPDVRFNNCLWGTCGVALKWWYRFPEKEKESEDDTYGDENPDIQEYYGNKELWLEYTTGDYHLEAMLRWNFSTGHGAQQVGLSRTMLEGESLSWYVQYWNGYGESLIDYRHTFTRWGIGLLFHW